MFGNVQHRYVELRLFFEMCSLLGHPLNPRQDRLGRLLGLLLRVIKVLLVCAGSVASLIFFTGYIRQSISQNRNKPLDHMKYVQYIQDVIMPLRGSFVLAGFMINEGHFLKLHLYSQNVLEIAPRRDAVRTTARITLLLPLLSFLLFVMWDFVSWFKPESDFSIDSFVEQMMINSGALRRLDVTMVRWKFYIIWCCLGLTPCLYSFVVQSVFFFYCCMLEFATEEYHRRLQQLEKMINKETKMSKIIGILNDVICYRRQVHNLSEAINKTFAWTVGAAFLVDVAAMLFNAAMAKMLSPAPTYVDLAGVAIYGAFLIAYNYPLLDLRNQDAKFSKTICSVFEKCIQCANINETLQIRMYLDALVLCHNQLKFDILAGGVLRINGTSILKACALIASISILTNQISSKDFYTRNSDLNCTVA